MEIATKFVRSCRRRRRCYWCGEFIEIGQSLWKYVDLVDGEIADFVFHPECEEAHRTDPMEYDYDEGPEEGGHYRGCWCLKSEPDKAAGCKCERIAGEVE